MPDALKARDGKDIEEAVRWALAGDKTLEVVGRGSKRALGRPSQSDITLDLSGLSGVTLYEPEELVLSAKAGTPIAEIESLVESKGQRLAFEPMDCGPVLGTPANAGSLGGVLATNLSGPRRFQAGAARDHFLGVSAVSGRGETFKSGGRVVKNVTGYDLCKLLAGSFGTLAVMTDVTIKTLPRPDYEMSLWLAGLDEARAGAVMAIAASSSCDVSGAAHVPGNLTHLFDGLEPKQAATVFRLEGVKPSVLHRRDTLARLLRPFSNVHELDESASRAVWRNIRDVSPFAADGPSGDRPLWRISTAPSRGPEIVNLVEPGALMLYDWAGGLIWLAPSPSPNAGAEAVRRAVHRLGGHATLIRAPATTRAAVDVFEPQEPGVAALTKRVKDSFDPKRVLNPGRMWAGV